MKRVRHPNLLGMLGCRLQSEPYLLLLEFQSGGSLEDWLLINDTDDFQKFQIMHQVTCGMTSLHELSIVHRWYYRGTFESDASHRDLAARNCLVDGRFEDGSFTVRVADLGLSRETAMGTEYYKATTKRSLPLRL